MVQHSYSIIISRSREYLCYSRGVLLADSGDLLAGPGSLFSAALVDLIRLSGPIGSSRWGLLGAFHRKPVQNENNEGDNGRPRKNFEF